MFILFHLVVEADITKSLRSAPPAFNTADTMAVVWLPESDNRSAALQISSLVITDHGKCKVIVLGFDEQTAVVSVYSEPSSTSAFTVLWVFIT